MKRYRIHIVSPEVTDVEDIEEAAQDILENLGFYIELEEIDEDE